VSPTFRYRRHFLLLVCAVAVIVVFGYLNPFTEPYLPTFVLCGALHATALVLSAVVPQPWARQVLFVALAAALNAAILYVGIFVLPTGARLYTDLAVCSGLGALAYGLLIRRVWIRDLTPRAVAMTLLVCIAATSLTLAVRSLLAVTAAGCIAAAWWFAFSAGLALFEARRRRVR
jgi:hypothetical protein